jgi:tetratricopeptide (TPR) repeat protein
MTAPRSRRAFVVLPDPGRAGTLDQLTEELRLLKVWAGDPSYDTIKDRINTAWRSTGRLGAELTGKSTVADCFRSGRRRLNTDLVLAVVRALHPDEGYTAQWRQALQVIGGQRAAAAQVRVQDSLPQDLAGFTGRTAELEQVRRALHQRGAAVVISAIAGMAGVGKTRLAVHAGHLVHRDDPFDRVLFVNLRGFHPDPAQPPADPGAVLDGFLRLLGVPGHRIPHELPARAAAYRARLAGSRTLVVLDNAADADQVRPLLPGLPGCPVLVTSRRALIGLHPATHLTVDVFTAGEAVALLTRAAPGVPVGDDRHARSRIARRCGHLPLALGLVAAQIRGTPGWTLSDHADRLDERHRDRRLDAGVHLALDLSYHHLPADLRRLLRLAALHPGQDFDASAGAVLAGTDLPTARADLDRLCRDHLLQQAAPGRYTLHDLVRAYAGVRAGDEDPPVARRAALTRLFDHYLAAAATAMEHLHPGPAPRRPGPSGAPLPAVTGEGTARAWLDDERCNLVTVAGYAAGHGWPAHTIGLSSTLYRYLVGGHLSDAVAVHGHAVRAAREAGDVTGQARALNSLGVAHLRLGRYGPAAEHIRGALELFRRTGDRCGEAGMLNNLAEVDSRTGRYGPAAARLGQALSLFRQLGNRADEACTLDSLGTLHLRRGRPVRAGAHYRRALGIFREIGDRDGEASALNGLGAVAHSAGRTTDALTHYTAAHRVAAGLGDRYRLAGAHTGLGHVHHSLDQPARAGRHYRQALELYTGLGMPDADELHAHLATIGLRSA